MVATIAMLAAGCGSTREPIARPRPADLGYRAVLSASDLDGRRVADTHRDADATIAVVFASWCGPCRHELAMLGDVRERWPTVRIVGVNAYEEYASRSDADRLRDFLTANAPWLQVVRADDCILRSLGGVPKVPTMFVFDRRGELVHAYRRAEREPPTAGELERALAAATAR